MMRFAADGLPDDAHARPIVAADALISTTGLLSRLSGSVIRRRRRHKKGFPPSTCGSRSGGPHSCIFRGVLPTDWLLPRPRS